MLSLLFGALVHVSRFTLKTPVGRTSGLRHAGTYPELFLWREALWLLLGIELKFHWERQIADSVSCFQLIAL